MSKKEANSKMFVPSISHSQFLKHQLGWFLGTVDVRKGSELEAECSLKFFEWSDVQSKYRLGAQVCSKVFALTVHFLRQEVALETRLVSLLQHYFFLSCLPFFFFFL